jgi:hypothetical protein
MLDKNGYGTREEVEKIAESVWSQLKSFGGYAFP